MRRDRDKTPEVEFDDLPTGDLGPALVDDVEEYTQADENPMARHETPARGNEIQSPEFQVGVELGKGEGRRERDAAWRDALRFCLLRTRTPAEEVEPLIDRIWAWGQIAAGKLAESARGRRGPGGAGGSVP